MPLAANFRGRASRVPESVSSRENQWLKQFRAALAGEKPRAKAGCAADLVGVEGPHLVEAALHAGIGIAAVLLGESGEPHLQALGDQIPESTRLFLTSDKLFASVSGTETPQGIAALVQPRQASFDDLVRGIPLLLLMAGIQDPGNVGTLLRTAETFGASGVVACTAGGIGTADPFGPKALRASAGSALRLPILRGAGAPVLLAQLRIAGVRVFATSPEAQGETSSQKALAPWEVNWREPAAFLLGNEGAGLPAELLRSSDAVVRIPRAASQDSVQSAESLNAAVAGAILLYEAARQRGFAS